MRRAILLFLLFLGPGAFGQSNYAVVSGTITDPQQGPVAGAAVVLTSNETHAERRVTTNSQGIFQITGILPGQYTLLVTASGFAQLTHALRLEVGQQLDLSFSLKLASASDMIQVDSTAADVLHTVDASIGEAIEPAAVSNLPLNGRILIDLVLTVPGAHAGHGAQTGTSNPLYWRPGQASAITIGGNRPNSQIDGQR